MIQKPFDLFTCAHKSYLFWIQCRWFASHVVLMVELFRLRSSAYFNQIIQGVLYSFIGLLFTVTVRFALNVKWDITHILLSVAALAALLFKVDILWVVLAGILLSIIFIH